METIKGRRRIGIMILLILMMSFMVLTVAAGADTHSFFPSCYGPGGATTAGSVSPGPFLITYVGSSSWTDTKVCNDFLGCVYFVRQSLSQGERIDIGGWGNLGLLDIWTGWCG